MFGRISVVRRCFFAVRDSNTLLAPLRYFFKVVPFPGLVSLLLLCILYSIAEYKFTDWYFALGYVWKPAFPSSWRILFLLLFVVPTFSFLHLVWLCVHHLVLARHGWGRTTATASPSRPSQGYSMLPRSESNSMEERGDDDDCDVEDIERDVGSSRPHYSSQHQAPRHPLSFIWSPRFIFWFAILCASLWFGLDYKQPGDVRYLSQIEKANAHPRRTGYANQGKYEQSKLDLFH